ncbi:hypothetical protein Pmani_018363 [Petrolisthes manimaculis]|uniref:Phosphoglycerate mutase n=1 Tax=Petrolisthes manimaculis TaxID=1843537 RepID=A0AAE1PMK9_9EUCA|nr:hypothetical protein Pmani_018363 [Petrolisthes manimaculis]
MKKARQPIVFAVTFVRHGETQANKEHRIQGHLDIPLSPHGESQALQAGVRLKDTAFSRAYSSDLSRAYTTCQIILGENCCQPPSIVVDEILRERNFGSAEGVHVDEFRSQAEAEGKSWTDFNPPGSESLGDLQARMVKFFKEMCQSVYDKNKGSARDDVIEQDMVEAEKNCVEDLQTTDLSDAVEHLLVVGHGAALKQLYIHLHSTLGCLLPPQHPHPQPLTIISPNSGISQYLVRYMPKKYNLLCLKLHDGDHLQHCPQQDS